MKIFTSSLVIGGLSAMIGLSSFAQANAVTMPQVSTQPGYYNGYNGRGAWIPASARPAPVTTGDHASWCADHYKTYRASDNTFEALNGSREQCK
jgi:hypothetical protein